MTKDDSWDDLLALAATNIWAKRFPDLPRHVIRHNVCCALRLIPHGLMYAQVCGMTGEINEVTNLYEVRVP